MEKKYKKENERLKKKLEKILKIVTDKKHLLSPGYHFEKIEEIIKEK